MKIEKQISTPAQSGQFKNCGITQRSNYTWWFSLQSLEPSASVCLPASLLGVNQPQREFASAYTLAELNVMLGDDAKEITYNPDTNKYYSHAGPGYEQEFDFETHAAGERLMWRLLTGLNNTVVNARLQAVDSLI